jgi:micrococcal nuclease
MAMSVDRHILTAIHFHNRPEVGRRDHPANEVTDLRQNRRRRQRPARLERLLLGLLFITAAGGMATLEGCTPRATVSPAAVRSGLPSDIDFSGRVTRIVDGDTFWISSQDVRIRVWGLDAPETRDPGGAAATAELTRLIAAETLYCRQRDIDRYGRIVGQCFLPDGRDITAAMIASGTAREFCRFSRNHYGTC